MIDRYTKIVLTVIAASLAALVVQNLNISARAQSVGRCGDAQSNPCFVAASPKLPLYVAVNPRDRIYVATAPLEPLEVKINR